MRPWLLPFAMVSLTVPAGGVSMDHDAKLSYDFGGLRVPEWSGGALVNFISNQTTAPILLSFDEQGREIQPVVFTIPGVNNIDLDDIARSPDGSLAVCGTFYDQSGKRWGFFAITSVSADQPTVVRLDPYYPTRITVAADGTIWTAGLELVNGKETDPRVKPDDGVIRHFDRAGKQLGSFIPRSSLASLLIAQYGILQSASGRIGWYSGPINGPGSMYYEFLSDGTVRKYPSIHLNKSEYVTGLALTDDGRTYVTTNDGNSRRWRFLSIAAPDQQWVEEPLPPELKRSYLYGGEGNRLVFHTLDRFSLVFADASR